MGAQAIQNQQEKFIHYLSHDLREPARMVSQFLKLVKMRNEKSMDKTSEEYLEYAISASDKMDNMIKSLSDISKVKHVNEEKSEIVIEDLVNEILEKKEGKMSLRSTSVSVVGDEVVMAKRQVLKEVLSELVSNCLQHASDRDVLEIRINASQYDNLTKISVHDNGEPMDDFWKERAFDLFQKKNRASKNSGIGLTKIKMLVEKCQGKIWIDNSELGGVSVNCELA